MPTRNKFRFGAPADSVPRSVAIGVMPIWVQCKGYRCLAYQNADGRWVNFYTGKQLADFVEVIG